MKIRIFKFVEGQTAFCMSPETDAEAFQIDALQKELTKCNAQWAACGEVGTLPECRLGFNIPDRTD